jgi:hypothetical protein
MAHQLILCGKDGVEIGRRPMEPNERYALYAAYNEGELFSFAGSKYRLHSVAWRKPEQDCIVLVSFDSYEPVEYCDD